MTVIYKSGSNRNHSALYVFLYSFFIHFFWEMWQMPLFMFSQSTDLPAMNWMCTQASLGDGVIAVISYYFVFYINKKHWLSTASFVDVFLFILPGMALTIVLEHINTGFYSRWEYDPLMPIVPIIGIGLFPLLQWIVIPPMVYLASKKRAEQ